jgi:phospholipase/carboxylesterase
MTDSAIVIETGPAKPDGCVIWLHGLGADGHDFEPIVNELNLAESLSLRFIFPHAPMMAVTINNGFVMRAWYDIKAMDIGSEQDESGIRESQSLLEELINQQIAQGISSERILLAGFSQGGAVILQTGLRFHKPLAGLMALSTYLPIAHALEQEKSPQNAGISIFYGHGDSDPVVRPELAYMSRSRLEQQGYHLEWHEYTGMQHSLCAQEIQDISLWIGKVLPA